ncbi:hypothetical protein GLOIN_2v1774494 [Rhizophagus clarus]|uniref:C2H2-type domain-containing protein n=1 Tax=Rhizophagus clarus TaxID=94130 RepID=A0A8H3M1U7_9GLOM|nr:hypothetical protein GLOIN_2v1774494 [Rhizophagus clarus]
MIQSGISNGIASPPIMLIISTTTTIDLEFECNVYRKAFKSKSGLTKHLNIVRSMAEISKQIVFEPTTKSQFYAIFKNHIYYYSTRKNVYKCIFHGILSNQILANILKMQEWRIKFYEQCQCTYVVLCNNDIIESDDENPILQVIKYCKSRYKYG